MVYKIEKPPGAIRYIAVFFICLMLLIHGCARVTPVRSPAPAKPPPTSHSQPKPYYVMGKWYQPISDAGGFVQHGKASWYGKKFHGRKTSNGETYNMYGVSAAHKTLPMNTWVRVTNLENNRELDVRVNDRGPFVTGRIIDLSYGAAQKLGVVGPGTAEVQVVALGRAAARKSGAGNRPTYAPVNYQMGNFTFQVGAFRDRGNAEKLKKRLALKYKNAHIIAMDRGDGVLYKVRVGQFSTLVQAESGRQLLTADGFGNPFIVAE